MRQIWLSTLVLMMCGICGLALGDDPSFDAVTGYRIAHYRSPTPDTVPGGITVTLEELQRLHDTSDALMLDVAPSQGPGLEQSTDKLQAAKERRNMKGSVWLPDVGRGALTPQLDTYFRQQVGRLIAHDTSRPIIIYCMADCWMSWNAVKRAASYGYTSLYWYPDGTDGMRDWDIPLVVADPLPLESSHQEQPARSTSDSGSDAAAHE